MRVIVVEPFNMERHCSRFLCTTSVTQNFLNHELHVIATSGVSRFIYLWVIIENFQIFDVNTSFLVIYKICENILGFLKGDNTVRACGRRKWRKGVEGE